MKEVQIFIDKTIDESCLIEYLNQYTLGGFASIDNPADNASYFIQLVDYSEGFKTGLNISWADSKRLAIDKTNLVEYLASELMANVLWEETDIDYGYEGKWFLTDNKGHHFAVRVQDLKDGIGVDTKIGKVSINR